LERGLEEPELETLKDATGFNSYMVDSGNQRDACEAAARYAESLGYNSAILSTKIEGESREVGAVLAGIAKEIKLYRRPFAPPCILVSAGETRVSISGECGQGGPNQELALGFALTIAGYDNVVLASIDSEGTDGPTQFAGGITDSSTSDAADRNGTDIFSALKRHDSLTALTTLGDAIQTIPTGTNVVNLRMMFINEDDPT
jgi:glycerate-2-kinase